jgi:uncharacterized protein YbjT (DUF2867 family)
LTEIIRISSFAIHSPFAERESNEQGASMTGKGTVLVAGATGITGGMIVRKLLARGERVRALVREGSDHEALAQAGAEIAVGDLKRPLSIRKAMEGVDRVISTATASSRGGEDTIEAVDRIGTAALIEAAREAGVRRFVFVSAWGFGKDMPFALARAKMESERRLAESGVPWTVLRPGMFMDVWIGWVLGTQIHNAGRVVMAGDKDARYGFVAAENVADLAVAALDEPRAVNATITFLADVASFPDIVKRIGKATGRSIPVEAAPAGEPIEGLPPVVVEIWERLSGSEPPEPTEEVARAFGIQPVTLDQFIERTFKAEGAPAPGMEK